MVQFGDQLEGHIHEPWRDHYITYNKLKRIIERNRFVLDSTKAKNAGATVEDVTLKKSSSLASLSGFNSMIIENTMESTHFVDPSQSTIRVEQNAQQKDRIEMIAQLATPTESTPLRITGESEEITHGQALLGTLPGKPDDVASKERGEFTCDVSAFQLEDFFEVVGLDLEKVNGFFLSKMKELKEKSEKIEDRRSNSSRMYHTGENVSENLRLVRGIYIELLLLIQYIDFNRTGFIKIVKKHDKVMKLSDLGEWKNVVKRQPFAVSLEPAELMESLSNIVGRDKLIEWEKHINQEMAEQEDVIFSKVRPAQFVVSVIIFTVAFAFPLFSLDLAASKCFALLLFTMTMWILEAMPYYATALLICPLVVILRVLKYPANEGESSSNVWTSDIIMSQTDAATQVYQSMWNHTSVLLLGGYCISAAFSRCQLELRLASWLQRRLGNHPRYFILAVMFLGLFLSTWISNSTAPILISSFITPVIRDLPTSSRFTRCLLLGLAISCNFGGMMTPISSMQNALAVNYLTAAGYTISFGEFMCISVPFCSLCVFLSWIYLMISINPDDVKHISTIVYERKNAFSNKNMVVMTLSIVTIVLFAASSLIVEEIGDIGMISLIFVSIMFGSGILTEVDFNSLSWHTLFLIGGGNVLGTAVSSSGLLNYISTDITSILPMRNFWSAIFCILLFSMLIGTFVSHTVAAIILLPVIVQLASALDDTIGIVICSTFAISAAMALPFSSFPNVNSFLIVDDFRRPYLSVTDFVQTGLPVSIFTLFLISTFAFALVENVLVME